jgi:aryl-alcohol dehydrogenase-like predicted oxidoreductase
MEAHAMDYRKLRGTEIEISAIALGCWPFGAPDTWGRQDDEVSIATVKAALDAGINFFDTAEGYGKGKSEEVLGRGLKGRRQEAVIATKVGSGDPEQVQEASERSLRYLDTDVIDLYQIHWPRRNVPIPDTMGALERLVEQGKVRAIGVCNFGVGDMGDLPASTPVLTNQLPFGLLWRPIEDEIQPMCVERGFGILCYSPLSQGLLTGRYASADEVFEGLRRTRLYAGSRPEANHGEPGCEAEVFAAVERVREIAAQVGASMTAVSLAWARQQAGVTSLLVGARSSEELEEDLPGADLVLSDGDLKALADATEEVKQKLGGNPDMWMSESRFR